MGITGVRLSGSRQQLCPLRYSLLGASWRACGAVREAQKFGALWVLKSSIWPEVLYGCWASVKIIHKKWKRVPLQRVWVPQGLAKALLTFVRTSCLPCPTLMQKSSCTASSRRLGLMFAGTHRELPQGSRLFGVFWCELLGSVKLLRDWCPSPRVTVLEDTT